MHKKGEEREDHKYIKREWKNGKWIYFYPEDLDKGITNKSIIRTPLNKNNLESTTTLTNTTKKTKISSNIEKKNKKEYKKRI